MAESETWYTISVVQHVKHPRRYIENDTDKPIEVISCTVLPHLAGDILRATAEQIGPRKPVMRRGERTYPGLPTED